MLNSYKDYADVVRLSDALQKVKNFAGFNSNMQDKQIFKLISKNHAVFGYNKKPSVKDLSNAYANALIIGDGNFAKRSQIVSSYSNFKKTQEQEAEALKNNALSNQSERKESGKQYGKYKRKIYATRAIKGLLALVGLSALGGLGYLGFFTYGAISAMNLLSKIGIWSAYGVGSLIASGTLFAPGKAIWNKLSSIAFKNKMKLRGTGKGTSSERKMLKQKQKGLEKGLKNNLLSQKVSTEDLSIISALEADSKKINAIQSQIQRYNQAFQNVQPNVQPTARQNTHQPQPQNDQSTNPSGPIKPAIIPLEEYGNLDEIDLDKFSQTYKNRQDWFKNTSKTINSEIDANAGFKFNIPSNMPAKGSTLVDWITSLSKTTGEIKEILKSADEQFKDYYKGKKDKITNYAPDLVSGMLEDKILDKYPDLLQFNIDEKEQGNLWASFLYRYSASLNTNVENLALKDESQINAVKTELQLAKDQFDKYILLDGTSIYADKVSKMMSQAENVDEVYSKEALTNKIGQLDKKLSFIGEISKFIEGLKVTGKGSKAKNENLQKIKDDLINRLNEKVTELKTNLQELDKKDYVSVKQQVDNVVEDNKTQFKANEDINDLYKQIVEAKLEDINALQKAKANTKVPPEPGE